MPCPHTREVLAKVLMDTLYDYRLENKISAIVVDNCSTNDAMMDILVAKFDSSSLLLGGNFLHMGCSAHIINLTIKDGFDAIVGAIEKICENVAFWLATPKRIEKFDDSARSLKIPSAKKLVLDCKTGWNSTYLMLETVFAYREVFSRLRRLNSQVKLPLPCETEWELARMLCEKLQVFYKATELLLGRNYPTSNLYFREVCEIKIALHKWVHYEVRELRDMASKMLDKFNKYWLTVNGILAIATILDPRNKMDCVDFYFNLIYGEYAESEIQRIKNLLVDLLMEYKDGGAGSLISSVSSNPSPMPHDALGKRPPGGSGDLYSQHKEQNKKKKGKCSV